jgi:hypothetical protein
VMIVVMVVSLRMQQGAKRAAEESTGEGQEPGLDDD